MGNNLFFGGIIMKELFSSAISVFTSLALISSSAISYASAAGSVPVDSDLSRETLYLDEADDLTFTAADTPLILSNFSEGTYNYKDFLDDPYPFFDKICANLIDDADKCQSLQNGDGIVLIFKLNKYE